ncbi:hypothetical protein V474_13555 [Novosphingobium barchaimii LL02]|uniref:Uncharacterized protein n=1 Tax=Novosphingobium barchaimii LL02 TaxID=1114963 RepID=A0A0J7XZG8_9SPHN|nr:hypothetical protein V474_13555 [Novosphingobium barchaimii LL02]
MQGPRASPVSFCDIQEIESYNRSIEDGDEQMASLRIIFVELPVHALSQT